MMTEIQCEPEQSTGRIIFMSMYNDIQWWEKGNEEMCISIRIPELWQIMRKDSRTVIGRFFGLVQKRSGTEHTHVQTEWSMGSCR